MPASRHPTDPESESQPCECELPGIFCCGVPGILAHFRDGRLAAGCQAERCGLCERYPTDQSAYGRVRERGLAD